MIAASFGDGRMFALRVEVDAASIDASSRLGWVHVAKVGEWNGHKAGPFKLTAARFDAIVERVKAQRDGEIVFDFEHSSLTPGVKAIASGWIRDLEARGDELWALVEWTEDAAKHIRAKEYRYASAVFGFGVADPVTGEPIDAFLHSVALTNTPFIKGLNHIALTAGKPGAEGPKKMEEIQSAPEAPVAVVDKAAEALERLMKATGLAAETFAAAIDSKLEAIVAAITGTSTIVPATDTVVAAKMAVQDGMIRALTADLSVFKAEAAARAKALLDTEIAALVGSKKIDAADAASWRALAEKDRACFVDLSSKLSPKFPAGHEASAMPGVKPEAIAPVVDMKHPRVVALCAQYARSGIVINDRNVAHYSASLLAAQKES